ncbi:hypothetical protein ADL07_06870 [Streptomyces sp. NRRL F-4707]|nr:hypothetical protein ADL07_06870 [Streptomyces sp. NRRL F-4707]
MLITPAPSGASWCRSIAPVGSNAPASPAPGVAGADRHRGAPIVEDATEGGSHPEREEPRTCHSTDCAHAAPSKPRVQQRERLRDEKKRVRQPSCRMNDDEYQLLVRAAAECHMSVAGFLARAALNAARDLNRTAADIAGEKEMLQELFALRRHLGQIGNNLNQVAKALNSGADAPQAAAVLAAVQRAAKRVDAFTQQHLENQAAA